MPAAMELRHAAPGLRGELYDFDVMINLRRRKLLKAMAAELCLTTYTLASWQLSFDSVLVEAPEICRAHDFTYVEFGPWTTEARGRVTAARAQWRLAMTNRQVFYRRIRGLQQPACCPRAG